MNHRQIITSIWPVIHSVLPRGPYPAEEATEKNMAFMEAVLWLVENGGNWANLPAQYGNRFAIYQKFNRWSKAGVWEEMFRALGDYEQTPIAYDGQTLSSAKRRDGKGLRVTRRVYRRRRR